LSVTPCWRRIQKLEEAGIIRGRVALLDKDKLGLGAVVKARDGNKRGAEVAIGAVIRALGYPIEESLKDFFQPKLFNWAGDEVGDITTPDFVCHDVGNTSE
jgi:DNA-binding Lrp family transcriptional regulator